MHAALYIPGVTEGPQYQAIEKDGKVTWYSRYGSYKSYRAIYNAILLL